MDRILYRDLVRWKNEQHRKPLLLKGARQVGKTWLLTEFGKKEFSHLHTINFEKEVTVHSLFEGDLEPSLLLRNIELYLNHGIDRRSDLIFFDEVQECPRALTSLKYFAEDLPELAVCCAGSHIGLTLGTASFPIGKIDILTLHPLSFREFLTARQENLVEIIDSPSSAVKALHARLWEALKLYYFTGGMPEPVQMYLQLELSTPDTFSKIREVQSRLIEGYRADFSKHAGKTNAAHINRVFDSIPVQITKTVDDASVGRYRFKEVVPGYSKFSQLEGPIDWLISTGLVQPVYIVDSPAIPLRSRRKDNTFKLFLFDIGLLGCMSDIPAQSILSQDFGTYKGFLAENYAAQELKSSGVSELYSWKGKTSEIEFLAVIDDKIVPIEVKSGNRIGRAKSLAVYREKYKPEMEIILSSRPESTAGNRLLLPLYKTYSIPALELPG